MKTFELFRTQIYNKWKPTNKIFFGLSIIALLFAIFAYIFPLDSFSAKIKISPNKILLANNNKNFSPTLSIENKTDEIINQIWLKLTLNSNDISLRNNDISLSMISENKRMSIDIYDPNSDRKINVGDIISCYGAIDSFGKQAFYIFIHQLVNNESLQFQIINNYPYRLKGEHFFKVTILHSSKEPAEMFTKNDGSMELLASPIGEKITIFRYTTLIKTKAIN